MFQTLLFFFFSLHLFSMQAVEFEKEATVTLPKSDIKPFALFTIPKSGSHLVLKALFYMTGFTPYWHTDPPNISKLLQESRFPYTHCCLSPTLLNYYARSTAKQILTIRDLRDVCVSIVYQIRKGVWPEFTHNLKKRKEFESLSFDEQLLFVIEQDYKVMPPEILLQLGIAKVAEQAVKLTQNPSILICPFEKLVGAQGGGSQEEQKELLKKIALHIGLCPSSQEIDDLALKLFGNQSNPFGKGDFIEYQSTFREGKIGAWKSLFKEQHKIAFKKRLGQALIALGYEQNNEW